MTLHEVVLDAMNYAASKLEEQNIQAKITIEIENPMEWQYFKYDQANLWVHMSQPSKETGYLNHEPVFVYNGKHVVKGPQ